MEADIAVKGSQIGVCYDFVAGWEEVADFGAIYEINGQILTINWMWIKTM